MARPRGLCQEGPECSAKNESLTAVGIDETSLKRGHNYISLFVDLAEKKTIFVGEGKDNSTVRSFVNHLEATQGNRGNIKDVSCDMSPAFIKGVGKICHKPK